MSRSSVWELRGELPRWNEESPGLRLSWVVPLAGPKKHSRSSVTGLQIVRERSETAQIAPESAREIGSRVRGCAETARWVARDPAARKAAQVKVRSKCYAKKVETMNSSKLALAEELATLSGCEPFYPRSEATCSRSLVRLIVQAMGRHHPISLSCDYDMLSWTSRRHRRSMAFKVNDAVTRGPGPVKKALEVKLSAIKHDTDTLLAQRTLS